jgi:membrane protease YdiL (CAAX protease family)
MMKRTDAGPDRSATAAMRAAILVYAVVVAKQILTWYVLYPTAGYNDITLNGTQAVTLLLGVLFVVVYRLGWRRIGLGLRRLGEAIAAVTIAYVVLLLVVIVIQLLGTDAPLFRESYSAYAFLNNWVLTGFAEELLFAGVVFTLVLRARSRERSFAAAWPVVLVVAALFSLWHLPGYIAVALRSGGLGAGLIVDLILPFLSWLFIGTIYVLSGNLWLAAFVHASTDYALLPAIVDRPEMGVVFMLANVAIAWWLGRRRQKAAGTARA